MYLTAAIKFVLNRDGPLTRQELRDRVLIFAETDAVDPKAGARKAITRLLKRNEICVLPDGRISLLSGAPNVRAMQHTAAHAPARPPAAVGVQQ